LNFEGLIDGLGQEVGACDLVLGEREEGKKKKKRGKNMV